MAGALNLGCTHYIRKCAIVTPCCDKVYTCRLCHDDKESHQVNRKEIIEIICKLCETKQYMQEACKGCGTRFAKYICLACRMFDDNDKGQFHCHQCQICRVGGKNNYTHCTKCDICISAPTFYSHKCLENGSHTDCPVCLEDIHSSTLSPTILCCGHFLHQKCRDKLIASGRQSCPICSSDIKA